MDYRQLGRTDMRVSAISFGAWAIGGFWGEVDDGQSMRALHAAIDRGVNFIDTADVYGDGRSERLVARLLRERPQDRIWVATKAGRRLPEQTCEGYSRANLVSWIDRSLQNLDTGAIDLLQLHCPPSALYRQDDVFGILDDLIKEGKLRLLRRQRRDRRRSARRNEASRRSEHPDHLQHVSVEAGRARVPRSESQTGRDSGSRAAGERDAHRQAATATRYLPQTIIASSTATGSYSTRERRSRASLTRSV